MHADGGGASAAPAQAVRIEVVYCPEPHRVDHVRLALEPGATVRQALEASGVLQRHGLAADALRVGIWGRPATLAAPLREADRVELYRGLQVDPKEARRLRYKRTREPRVTGGSG